MNEPSPARPEPPMTEQVRRAVLAMPMARTLGLSFEHLAPGEVTLRIPVQDSFCFQPGQLQATAVFAAADFAGVAAAGTLLAPGWVNATVDGTIKLLAPARGSHLLARGRVLQAGPLLSVCAADVYAVEASGHETLCASWIGTARNLQPRKG
ncbi:MAG: PaaI family thioesterase [Burkholderiales bacterium]|nr:PaaI family thioesterase [Burkholderiales bacterium]